MSDYISRDAAKKILSMMLTDNAAECACNLIDSVLPADVEPVRHGRWVRIDDDWNSLTTYQCTACDEEFCFEIDEDLPLLNYNYCPNCGAKMDLEDEEP